VALREASNKGEQATVDTIPPRLDETFLVWFRQRTEQGWSSGYPQRRWLPGLSEEEIAALEQTWNVRFPPDYRLFLLRLHAVGEVTAGAAHGRKHLMAVKKSKIVYNWLLDTKELRRAFTLPVRELGFHQPVATAPKLIPITWYLHLLGEPWRAGNPILSIHGTDIVVVSTNFRRHLLSAFGHLLAITPPGTGADEATLDLKDIPLLGWRLARVYATRPVTSSTCQIRSGLTTRGGSKTPTQ